ncbi:MULTISPECIES: DNA cytosine methyltransferase [Streptomyces]|uniref:DNA cytosine methyltransferase n=1 Tax=Streptomyces TaxID=1883 RepID=UPI00163C8AB3|nr:MULTISPECIES: DNA cytosine methyltransferase [Streptomyces]MBC2877952.1 DNA cytosine methyltransferase [Streptomyces sp. TYQ1024]UBI38077.1 DNA cytosine methyltransferase [Streptomyces mobaraensis]UKW30664.1 DNA cytosine methyltransferase [Streptomyces sp. TYQ1024]
MPELRTKRPELGTCVELFAGGGGLAMGVHNAGFRPLLVNEYAKRAIETLQMNEMPGGGRWPLKPGDVRDLLDDFKKLEGQVDVLAGGPPCQPFSLGGVAKGTEDERNMFPQMFRAIEEMRPKAVICENVRGLLRKSFDPYFQYILNEMRLPFVKRMEGASWEAHNEDLKKLLANDSVPASERYIVQYHPVNAADFGVPQIRQRVVIVAFRADLGMKDWENFAPKATHSDESLIHSMREGGEYWDRHRGVPEEAKARAIANRRELNYDCPKTKEKLNLQPWRTLRDAIQGVDEFAGRPLPFVNEKAVNGKEQVGEISDHFGWPGARVYTGHTPNLLDRPAKTVKAGVHGVPGGESVMMMDDPTFDGSGYRYMTVRETARVMTFPDEWTLAGPRGEKMRQLGNAVPVKLGKVFADAVAAALDSVGALEKSGGKQ